jgi:hypothetical protein
MVLGLAIRLRGCSRGETLADEPRQTVGAVVQSDGVCERFWKTETTPSRVKHPNSL